MTDDGTDGDRTECLSFQRRSHENLTLAEFALISQMPVRKITSSQRTVENETFLNSSQKQVSIMALLKEMRALTESSASFSIVIIARWTLFIIVAPPSKAIKPLGSRVGKRIREVGKVQ